MRVRLQGKFIGNSNLYVFLRSLSPKRVPVASEFEEYFGKLQISTSRFLGAGVLELEARSVMEKALDYPNICQILCYNGKVTCRMPLPKCQNTVEMKNLIRSSKSRIYNFNTIKVPIFCQITFSILNDEIKG